MSRLKNTFNSKYLLWFALPVPGIVCTTEYLSGSIYYGEYLHFTGEFSARLLILTMAITPLRLVFATHRWPVWLMRRRRYLGVATFAYAALHLAAYLAKLGVLGKIAGEALEPGMITGWVAMFVFIALALTSNDRSVGYLKARWKTLHRLVYVAAVMTFLHWILVAFDPTAAAIHAGILVLLETIRFWLKQKSQ